ncbi:MAG TPA: cell division protein FtsZ [Bacteroidia bacterium]|nr:cell division protein FtsZ [Bacteroidia bacterium]
MDFYSIFDEHQGEEGNGQSSAQKNDMENTTSSNVNSTDNTFNASVKPADGVPVRWDFKAILKQNESQAPVNEVENILESVPVSEVEITSEVTETFNETVVETPVASIEQTGDSDFDREWAEMIAREEAEKNNITAWEMDSSEHGSVEMVDAPVAEIIDTFTDETESFAAVKMSDEAEVIENTIVENPVTEVIGEAIIDETESFASVEMNSEEEIVATFKPVLDEGADDFEMEETATVEIELPVAGEIELAVAEMNTEIENTENEQSLSAEEFVPITLAGEIENKEVEIAPVFVSVEHAWMYTEEPVESIAEAVSEEDFQSSLPGELPLFNGESGSGMTTMNTDTHTHNNLKSEQAMKFELPEYSSIIKVIGVGGGGSNAVNHMYKFGIKGVDFLVCNTDKQALDLSPVPHKIVLGTTLTEGRGAGSLPEVGRNAAIENIEDLRAVLSNNTKMVFITAGMGGGTGTGAAPVIAGVARELGILTVGIVTVPFTHEGKKRRQYAEEGIEQLKQNVDTLLVIRNDKLREMYGNLKLSDAFAHADDVLTTAAKSIAEIISITQQINVDFADICTVMRNSGVAIMGSAVASGENRAVRAVEMSLNSPLLNDNNIIGARYVLLNIISGSDEITMDELGEITDFIQEAAGQTAEIIKGYGVDPSLGESVSVTIIATGFQQTSPVNYEYASKVQSEKVVRHLDEQKTFEAPKAEITEPISESEVNPLEPFLVSKTVTETITETKEEWSAPVNIEFEVVNTSPEIIEPVNEVSDSNDSNFAEFTASVEEPVKEESSEPVLIVKEEVKAVEVDPIEAAKKVEQEEIQRRANERIQKLRDISLKLKSPQVLNEMENEPAYKRRNIALDNVPHSSESQVSRFTLTETDEKKVEIRPNNSFLHDNVD